MQAIALAVTSPVLGKLVDKFGQRQVSIPTIIVWMVAAISLVSCITARVPSWILFCIVPFMAAIPPWGAMSRQRWTTLLKGDAERTNRALSLSGVFDECMWVIGNPLASTLAVISGLLAFSFTGICVVVGALMFLTELTTEPKSQTQLAREAGMTRKEYRERGTGPSSKALQTEAAVEYARDKARAEGKTAAEVEGRDAEGRHGYCGRQQGIDLGSGPDCGVRDVVRFGRVPVGRRHFDRRVRHRGAYEAVHRFRIRLLLVQLSDRRARVMVRKIGRFHCGSVSTSVLRW